MRELNLREIVLVCWPTENGSKGWRRIEVGAVISSRQILVPWQTVYIIKIDGMLMPLELPIQCHRGSLREAGNAALVGLSGRRREEIEAAGRRILGEWDGK